MKFPRGVYVDFRRTPEGGWRGEIRFALTDGGNGFRVSGTDEGTSGGAAIALHRAARLADKLTSDPAVLQLLPPGSLMAMQTVKTLARAARKGLLGTTVGGKPLYKHFTGALGSLAKSLHRSTENKSSQLSGGPLLLADRHDDEMGCP